MAAIYLIVSLVSCCTRNVNLMQREGGIRSRPDIAICKTIARTNRREAKVDTKWKIFYCYAKCRWYRGQHSNIIIVMGRKCNRVTVWYCSRKNKYHWNFTVSLWPFIGSSLLFNWYFLILETHSTIKLESQWGSSSTSYWVKIYFVGDNTKIFLKIVSCALCLWMTVHITPRVRVFSELFNQKTNF